MDQISIHSDKGEIKLRKSKALVGLKMAQSRGLLEPDYINKELHQSLCGFKVVELSIEDTNINRKAEEQDKERYQTIYAKEEGAVAAPTAGLHFTRELMKRLEIKGISFAELTLHVGLGTFRSIDVEDLSKHKMDAEYFRITDETSEIVNTSKRAGHKVYCPP